MGNNSKEVIISTVKISNPEKIVFKNLGITKKDVALYYQKIAVRMLPFLKNRIISTIRCPDGVDSTCFYKKHLEKNLKGMGMINLPRKSDGKEDFYYIKDISGIISEVQMNAIEFHPWGSKLPTLEKPDIMVFDLDPDEGMDLGQVRNGVRDLKSLLDELNLKSFLKTSGSKGYHVVLPFSSSTSWDKFSAFAKNIALLMEQKWPNLYTTNIRKINRKGKIFVDWIRNTRSATSVAPYSLRTKNIAVSMPINWSELDKISPNNITMSDAIKRLKRKDPWEDFFKVKQEIK